MTDENGDDVEFKITVYHVIRHTIAEVQPPVRFHLGVAFTEDDKSTLASLNVRESNEQVRYTNLQWSMMRVATTSQT